MNNNKFIVVDDFEADKQAITVSKEAWNEIITDSGQGGDREMIVEKIKADIAEAANRNIHPDYAELKSMIEKKTGKSIPFSLRTNNNISVLRFNKWHCPALGLKSSTIAAPTVRDIVNIVASAVPTP